VIPEHIQTQDCSNLIRDLVLEFPLASDAVLTHALRQSFSNFCEKSHFWHMQLDTVVVEDEVTTYELSPGNYFLLLDIKKVTVPDGEVKQSASDTGIYARWDQSSADSIDLYSIDPGDEVTIVAAVKPVEYNDGFYFSKLILADYREAILNGARAYLFRLPQKEWTDLQQFQLCDTLFNSVCGDARRRQKDSFSRSGNRVSDKPRTFY
jgi:hypothetical protein